MQRTYTNMSNIPSHANAYESKVANGREGFGIGARHPMVAHLPHQMSQQGGHDMTCHFPQPAPKRVYCHPAAFSSLDGRSHHRLLDAYGHSRPASM